MDREPLSEAEFADLEALMVDAKVIKQLENDFADFVYHEAELTLFWNPELKLASQPGVSKEEFDQEVARAAQEMRDEEAKELRRKYQKKIDELVKTPKKKDIFIDLFGVAWFPHWQVEQAGEIRELPGFIG